MTGGASPRRRPSSGWHSNHLQKAITVNDDTVKSVHVDASAVANDAASQTKSAVADARLLVNELCVTREQLQQAHRDKRTLEDRLNQWRERVGRTAGWLYDVAGACRRL